MMVASVFEVNAPVHDDDNAVGKNQIIFKHCSFFQISCMLNTKWWFLYLSFVTTAWSVHSSQEENIQNLRCFLKVDSDSLKHCYLHELLLNIVLFIVYHSYCLLFLLLTISIRKFQSVLYKWIQWHYITGSEIKGIKTWFTYRMTTLEWIK